MPSTPSAPSLRHRSGGNSLLRSISRGARRDLLGGEVAHRLAQHGDGLAVVEAEEVHSGVSGVSGEHHQRLLHGGDVLAVLSVHLGARHGQRAARP